MVCEACALTCHHVRCMGVVQALGALPYVIALDQETGSVAVAIGGSSSIADYVTDLLCSPASAESWLPDSFKQVGMLC